MRRNSLHDTESVYTSNRTLIIRVFCDSRPSDESLYRQNGETLSGELNFVILPGMETLQLEPTTPPPSARMTQLSRGLTSFYRVVTTLARCRVSSEAVNWRYAKLTHYLRPALASGSLTVCVVMGCDRRSLAAGRRLGRLAQRATVRRRVNLEAVAAGLRERGRELGEELCVARGMLERVARELEEVRGEREELVKRNEEREREVAGLRGELERMRGMDGLREEMVNRKEDMKEDMEENMEEMKDMNGLREDMKEMVNRKEEMEEMKGRLEEKKKEVDGLKRMMEERRKEVDGLRGVVEEKNRELDTMREEREELERQLAAMRRPAVRDPTDKSDHEDPINTPIPVSSNNASDLAAMNNPINPTSIVNTPSTTNMTNPINQANPINTTNTINTTNPTNPTNETNPINSSNTPNPTSPRSQESLETLRERLREQETQTRLAALRSATLE